MPINRLLMLRARGLSGAIFQRVGAHLWAHSAGTVLAALPRPDFEADYSTGSLGDDATFTRASSATMLDSTGKLVVVGTNVPRFEPTPDGIALRKERGVTNLIPVSKPATPAWTVSTASLANDAGTLDIFGNSGASKVTVSGAAGYLRCVTAAMSGVQASVSAYLKKGNTTYGAISAYGLGSPSASYNFDTGVLSLAAGVTGFAEPIGNGWVRVFFTSVTTTTSGTLDIFPARDLSNTRAAGDYLYVDGVQGVTGYNNQTSLVVTTGATASRANESLIYTGSPQGPFTYLLDHKQIGDNLGPDYRIVGEGSATSHFRTTGGTIWEYSNLGFLRVLQETYAVNNRAKLAISFDTINNGVRLAAEGSTRFYDATAALATPHGDQSVGVGQYSTSFSSFLIYGFQWWNRALSEDEIKKVTQ